MRRFPGSHRGRQAGVGVQPVSLRISQHLGYALYCARSYAEAIQQYRKALEPDPNDASVGEALGDTYERNGYEAVEQWTKAMLLADDPNLSAFSAPPTPRRLRMPLGFYAL